MSLVTSFLGLFKHDTSNDADLNSNFDIDTALNENWDKVDAGVKKLNDEKVSKETGKPIGILLDTKGPEIRLGIQQQRKQN